jgi:dephospho-CoA kinase
MIVIGLTGSIGMGKSATLQMFAEEGAAVWDADAAVHRLYAEGGAAVDPVEAAFPGVAVNGAVERPRLAAQLAADPSGYGRLEAIVHPLVAQDRQAFLVQAVADGYAVAVVDIPLLFETGAQGAVDVVVVCSAPAAIQRQRVLARPGMTPERFKEILARQTPDADKRASADFVVDTSRGFETARAEVRAVLHTVIAPGWRGRHHGGVHSAGEPRE